MLKIVSQSDKEKCGLSDFKKRSICAYILKIKLFNIYIPLLFYINNFELAEDIKSYLKQMILFVD